MSDELDNRWREKYYDKCAELNAMESKLEVSEVHNNAMAAEIQQLREKLDEAVKALETIQFYCKHSRECACPEGIKVIAHRALNKIRGES
jgi:hypothetical protein